MKTLIFDVGGVLVYPRLGEWHIPYRAAEILGPERARDMQTEAFRRAHTACMPWLNEGRVVMDLETERLLRRGFVMDLDRAMGWRLTDAEIAALTDDFTDDIDRYGFFDDVKTWLERWSHSYTLGVLSDAMPSILMFLDQYGIAPYFKSAVISTHVGATKPDPRMYAATLRELGHVNPADCVFVDDRLVNIQGARAAGMKAVQMSRPEFPAEALWDGPVAHDFAELDRILREETL